MRKLILLAPERHSITHVFTPSQRLSTLVKEPKAQLLQRVQGVKEGLQGSAVTHRDDERFSESCLFSMQLVFENDDTALIPLQHLLKLTKRLSVPAEALMVEAVSAAILANS